MSRETSFQKLVGVTILKVDATCINQLILYGNNGNRYTIDVDVNETKIPELTLTKKKFAKKSKIAEDKYDGVWPFPPEHVREYD